MKAIRELRENKEGEDMKGKEKKTKEENQGITRNKHKCKKESRKGEYIQGRKKGQQYKRGQIQQ